MKNAAKPGNAVFLENTAASKPQPMQLTVCENRQGVSLAPVSSIFARVVGVPLR
jgi:hypothetical protein